MTSLSLQAQCYSFHEGPLCVGKHSRNEQLEMPYTGIEMPVYRHFKLYTSFPACIQAGVTARNACIQAFQAVTPAFCLQTQRDPS